MSYSCAEWRGEIGAYIVGALDGRSRARVSRHLVACPGCRADYDELVPVRGWLSQLAAAEGSPVPGRAGRRRRHTRPSPPAVRPGDMPVPHLRRDSAPLPGAGLGADGVPRRAAGLRPPAGPGWAAGPGREASLRRAAGTGRAGPRPRRLLALPARSWRWLLTAGAGLAAGAATAGVLLVASPAAPIYHAVSAASGVSGQAQLHSTPTGTEIDLTASGLPSGERCILVAVARDGADIAGTWDATYRGSARIAGTSAYPPGQLTALRIESDSGLLLLIIRV
ncbi:MAG TPA: anti-sigma factor [Streptosporangiaceae bacterium]|nr:anti-sigma factor [Streptosporangiaceae bacterium]